jgi:hypothetical protein
LEEPTKAAKEGGTEGGRESQQPPLDQAHQNRKGKLQRRLLLLVLLLLVLLLLVLE